jgi:phage terminase large subunit-like protein
MASRRTRPTSSSADPVTAYAEDVVAGRIVAGPHVRDTCARHLRDLVEGPGRGLTWDLEAASRALRYFPTVLRLAEGQFDGQPLTLHPSQAFIVGSIFGWKRADGTRRFRRAFVEEGKGNGKSPMAAGIGLYGLSSDAEPGAQVYSAAAKMDQARILFTDAVNMVERSPRLKERLTFSGLNPVHNIADLTTSSFFRPVGRDTGKTGSGHRPHFVLADEIHEMPSRDTLEMLERGFKFRRQPLLLMITNSGSDRTSVCWEEHEHAVKVAAGEVEDDTTFSYVCALDEGDDPLADPNCWPKANPLLGVTITESYLADVVAQAKAIPGKLNNILRLHFCVWTDAETAWMSREALEPALADFDPIKEHRDAKVWIGLDLSQSRDITALAGVVRTGDVEVEAERDGQVQVVSKPTYDAWIEAWTPGDTLDARALRDKAPYRLWVEQGHLNAPKGPSIRFDHVAQALAEYAQDFDVRAVAYDRYAFRSKFEPECQALGLALPFVEHPQGGTKKGKPTEAMMEAARAAGREPEGLWMPASLRELEDALLEGRIRLRRNPVLVAAMMSAVTDEDRWGNRWLAKERAVNKIDAAVALCMAVGAAMRMEDATPVGTVDDYFAALGAA